MQFMSIRCLNCHNVDQHARLGHDEIPYCSQVQSSRRVAISAAPTYPYQCACTSDLVPEIGTEQQIQEQLQNEMDLELSNMFSRTLNLSYQPAPPQQTPLTPPSSSPISPNFSISQPYHYSAQIRVPPSPGADHDPVAAQLLQETTFAQTEKEQQALQAQASAAFAQQQQQQAAFEQAARDREYAEYLINSDLSSPNSRNELEIAVAHGLISNEEYRAAVEKTQQKALMAQQAEQHAKALKEDCSAMDMLSSARQEKKRSESDPMSRRSEWCNDYYGGVDQSYMDEEAPCSVGGWEQGCRLKPFDYY
jgi:hypothetical protein